MSRNHATPPDGDWYRIRVQGRLESRWSSWFDGLALSSDEDGTTLIQGPVADQAALHGLLTRIRDTGLPLVSVTRGARGSSR
ncbi:hypothetical protein ACT8ZV_05725 [Nocardioides sp. MAHUQ-72]|uniref:hypothetical protein n=1 Tax=unclassified Nocardioides TaxID=2615069 RepID=UPI0036225F64